MDLGTEVDFDFLSSAAPLIIICSPGLSGSKSE